jgi:hypothetical protein
MNEETEELTEIFLDYLNAQEANCVNAKQKIAKFVKAEPSKVVISEVDFLNLKYQPIKSDKIKDLECCFKSDNPVDTWQRCFNILKANNATIKGHYGPEGFTHRYWIYSEKYIDRFYRVKKNSKLGAFLCG